MTEQDKPKPQTEVNAGDAPKNVQKSSNALREEEVLSFWREHNIFEKSLKKDAPKGNFVFYDGPPYATGLPHVGHMIPSAVKDIIPRYKTMRGYSVPRRWGWDCHGLPIENLIEKELGLKDKKAIEDYGIDKFNKAAKDSVFRYATEWKRIIERSGRWVDMDNDYHTMDSSYTESVWWSFKTLNEKGLVYEAFKVMNFCPRCQTAISNFEVGLGYKDITDISVYAKFELVDTPSTFMLAWTTTPWTLPGNVALAVSPTMEYSLVEISTSDAGASVNGATSIQKVWLASDLIPKLIEKKIVPADAKVIEKAHGADLAGKAYKPVFDFYTKEGTLAQDQEAKRKNAWKIYTADFVTAEDGTGVVHVAPAFGDDDYKLSVAVENGGLPMIQHVSPDGDIKSGNGTLSGLKAKPKDDHQATDIEVIKLLAQIKTSDGATALFAKEKIIHPYPHCWRCDTPLLNYATSSWFVKVAEMRDKLVAENNKVNWVPKEIGEGRFGKWLEGARDWAVSRSRYWGAPLPVWRGEQSGKLEFIGGVDELKAKLPTNGNTYTLMRHGESESNIKNVINSNPKDLDLYALTERGRSEVEQSAKILAANGANGAVGFGAGDINSAVGATIANGKKITRIYASDFRRAKETAMQVATAIGLDHTCVVFDARLREINAGDFDAGTWPERASYFKNQYEKIFKKNPNGESVFDIKKRTAEFLYDIDSKHKDENILIVTHGLPLRMMLGTASGKTSRDLLRSGWTDVSDPTASLHNLPFKQFPHNEDFELDLHRPYIDAVTWKSEFTNKDGQIEKETMHRVPEVFDVWYDSGAMPFASNHYPFENKEAFENGDMGVTADVSGTNGVIGSNGANTIASENKIFPADFIAEGLDQTRGWFYSLMVLSVSLFDKSPFKNVSVNGLMLAEDGRKMSKKLNNYPALELVFDKYGVDAIRLFIASSPAVHGEEVLFAEKFVDEVNKKIFNRLENVYTFYKMYTEGDNDSVDVGADTNTSLADSSGVKDFASADSTNILDQWIISRLAELKGDIEKGLDSYQIDKASRPIGAFVDDLSTWYLRRSRDRFKADEGNAQKKADKNMAISTIRFVLLALSKIIAPFVPFTAEHSYLRLKKEMTDKRSAHGVVMPESVHLCDWPVLPSADLALIDSMSKVRTLVEKGLALRSGAGIKVRQPLAKFTYSTGSGSSSGEGNSVNSNDSSGEGDVNDDGATVLSPEFLQIMADELNVKEVVAGNTTELDTNITQDLRDEGMVRDIVRAVQEQRKLAKLSPSDPIKLTIECGADFADALKVIAEKYNDLLVKPVFATSVDFVVADDTTFVLGDSGVVELEGENGSKKVRVSVVQA